MAEKKRFIDDFEEYEVTEEHHPSRAGTVVRIIFYIMILLVNCAIIFRVCMAEDPKAVKNLKLTDALRAAYAEKGDELEIYTQSVYDMYTQDGVYYATGLFFCPSAGELQVSVRYNVRTADTAITGTPEGNMLAEALFEAGRFGVPSLSAEVIKRQVASTVTYSEGEMRNGDFFAFRLTDDEGRTYTPNDAERLTRILYVYHKLTFDGLPEDNVDYYLEIYPSYGGTPDYSTVLGRMRVYSTERSREEYSLSGSEKKGLS